MNSMAIAAVLAPHVRPIAEMRGGCSPELVKETLIRLRPDAHLRAETYCEIDRIITNFFV